MPADSAYLDASALTKLAVAEAETMPLRKMLRRWPRRLTSVLAAVELGRAARRAADDRVPERVAGVLRGLDLVNVDDDIVRTAVVLGPPAMRTLDAIHLATALAAGSAVGVFVCYDRRLARAARAAGLPVEAPA